MKNRVWVEIDPGGTKVVRIFKSYNAAAISGADISEWPKKDAVASVRNQVWENSQGKCAVCDNPINHNFHMNEKVPRGSGGEISLENSEALCQRCHLGPFGHHRNRKLHSGKKKK